MRTPRQIVRDNVARVRERIAEAARRAGREPGEITLVAVTKYVDAATAAYVLEAGCATLGESRPQQLWAKAAAPELAGARWHLVGRLQRNKIARTLPLVELVHSVDSERLLAGIDQWGASGGARSAGASRLNDEAAHRDAEEAHADVAMRVLLEVNVSGEAAKQGFAADEVRRLLPVLPTYSHVVVAGLMTMAPIDGGEAAARAAFAALRELREELSRQAPEGVRLEELSMGMSGDFEAGVAEGATMVRVGSSLFERLD